MERIIGGAVVVARLRHVGTGPWWGGGNGKAGG